MADLNAGYGHNPFADSTSTDSNHLYSIETTAESACSAGAVYAGAPVVLSRAQSSLMMLPPAVPPKDDPHAAPSAPSSNEGIPNPFADSDASDEIHNPFSDHSGPTIAAGLSQRETVLRPFHPTLEDELGVYTGDAVRVLEMYDDGWVLAEKILAEAGPSNAAAPRGLIPLACLRDSGNSDMSSLLNTKRVQSFYVNKQLSP